MRAVKIDNEVLKEIMESLPNKLKKKLIHMIQEVEGHSHIERVKLFVKQYDKDCPVDQMISHTIGTLINKIGATLSDLVQDEKRKGKRANGLDAAKIVIMSLRQEADSIEEVIKNHKCDDDCEHE